MVIYAIYAVIDILVFAIGVAVGSFLNVVIYRLPRDESFVKGFSHCPKCKHRLMPADLVPIFSLLFLRGKCRYCGEKISVRYLIVEIVMGTAGLMLYLAFTPAGAVLLFVVFSVLLCVTLIDADTQEIPDSLNIAIFVCGIIAAFVFPDVSILARIIGVFAVSVPLLIIALIINGAFGMGDVKLMAAAGLLTGWVNALLALFIALITGGIYAGILLATRRKGRKEHFAFGPFLTAGIFISLICGNGLIWWYLSLF